MHFYKYNTEKKKFFLAFFGGLLACFLINKESNKLKKKTVAEYFHFYFANSVIILFESANIYITLTVKNLHTNNYFESSCKGH